MNYKNIAFFFRVILALFLAINVWVWLRYAGAFWLSGNLGSIGFLVKSVSPLKTSLASFLILIVPSIVVSFFVHRSMSVWMRIILYALIGSVFSMLYLVFMAKFNSGFIGRQLWVFFAAGGLAGLSYSSILEFPWGSRPLSGNRDDVSQERRRMLGSLGLFAGVSGFLGALAGPFYYWKNQSKYVEVNVGPLKEGQLMMVDVGGKPVVILKRSPDVIHLLEQDNPGLLDPTSEYSRQPVQARNALRSVRPEYFVVYGICTHLGCAPNYHSNCGTDEDPCLIPGPQFFCPCHGGVFDLAGRVYRGTPPPVNMVVPTYEFASDDVVRVYFTSLAEEWGT